MERLEKRRLSGQTSTCDRGPFHDCRKVVMRQQCFFIRPQEYWFILSGCERHNEIGEVLTMRILIGLAAVWVFAGGFGPTTSSACSNDLFQRDCKPCKRPDGTL